MKFLLAKFGMIYIYDTVRRVSLNRLPSSNFPYLNDKNNIIWITRLKHRRKRND